MAYNPIHTNACPIDEAFSDPINARKKANGQMVFQKHQPNVYTKPQRFPTYLSNYTPNFPPPPGPGQNFDHYPRSNLEGGGNIPGVSGDKDKSGSYVASHVPYTECGQKYW